MHCVPVDQSKPLEGSNLPHLNPLSKHTFGSTYPLPSCIFATHFPPDSLQAGGCRGSRWESLTWGTSIITPRCTWGLLWWVDTKSIISFSPQLRLVSSRATAHAFSSVVLVNLVHQERQTPVLQVLSCSGWWKKTTLASRYPQKLCRNLYNSTEKDLLQYFMLA